MAKKQGWKIVVVSFPSGAELRWHYAELVLGVAEAAESEVLYFARYDNTERHDLLVKVKSAISLKDLARRLKKFCRSPFKVEESTPCSEPHGALFRVWKALLNDAKSRSEPLDVVLPDVMHWLCNMCGLSYLGEIAVLSRTVANFSSALHSDQQAALSKEMVRFTAEKVAVAHYLGREQGKKSRRRKS